MYTVYTSGISTAELWKAPSQQIIFSFFRPKNQHLQKHCVPTPPSLPLTPSGSPSRYLCLSAAVCLFTRCVSSSFTEDFYLMSLREIKTEGARDARSINRRVGGYSCVIVNKISPETNIPRGNLFMCLRWGGKNKRKSLGRRSASCLVGVGKSGSDSEWKPKLSVKRVQCEHGAPFYMALQGRLHVYIKNIDQVVLTMFRFVGVRTVAWSATSHSHRSDWRSSGAVTGLRCVCSVTFPPFTFSLLALADGHINDILSIHHGDLFPFRWTCSFWSEKADDPASPAGVLTIYQTVLHCWQAALPKKGEKQPQQYLWQP